MLFFCFQDETDFDTRLYRCLSVFRPLAWFMYKNLSTNGALPVYFLHIIIYSTFLALTVLRKWYIKDKIEDTNGPSKNSKKTESKNTEGLLHKMNENSDCNFILRLEEDPVTVYHIGKIFNISEVTLHSGKLYVMRVGENL